jgi:mRNA interferase MazF
VLVSRTGSYERRHGATVALVTTTRRGLRVEVPVGEPNGLDHPSVINCDELATVGLSALGEYIGDLDDLQRIALDVALRFALDVSD